MLRGLDALDAVDAEGVKEIGRVGVGAEVFDPDVVIEDERAAAGDGVALGERGRLFGIEVEAEFAGLDDGEGDAAGGVDAEDVAGEGVFATAGVVEARRGPVGALLSSAGWISNDRRTAMPLCRAG